MEQKYNQTQNVRFEIVNKWLFLFLGHCVVAGVLCCLVSFGILLAFCNPGNCTHFLVIRASEHPADANVFLSSFWSNWYACMWFLPLVSYWSIREFAFLYKISKTSALFFFLFVTWQKGWGKGVPPPPPPPPVINVRLLRSYNLSTYRVSFPTTSMLFSTMKWLVLFSYVAVTFLCRP